MILLIWFYLKNNSSKVAKAKMKLNVKGQKRQTLTNSIWIPSRSPLISVYVSRQLTHGNIALVRVSISTFATFIYFCTCAFAHDYCFNLAHRIWPLYLLVRGGGGVLFFIHLVVSLSVHIKHFRLSSFDK